MKPTKPLPNPSVHLFVCTNFKEKGEFCGAKGGKLLRDGLKAFVKGHPELQEKVKVTASGCLSGCERGIMAVCYPQGEWMEGLTPDDLPRLQNYLIEKCKS